MKHLKINLKLRQFPWNKYFFQIFQIDPICVVLNHNEPGPKGPMPYGKGILYSPPAEPMADRIISEKVESGQKNLHCKKMLMAIFNFYFYIV